MTSNERTVSTRGVRRWLAAAAGAAAVVALAARPAAADVTIHVDASWGSTQAGAAAISLMSTTTFAFRSAFLTLNAGGTGGSCDLIFQDADAGTFAVFDIVVQSCGEGTFFLFPDGEPIVQSASCPTDPFSTGFIARYQDFTGFPASTGQTSVSIAVPLLAITGTLSMPTGAQIAAGRISMGTGNGAGLVSFSSNAVAAIDSSGSYSFPALAIGTSQGANATCSVELPSGTNFSFQPSTFDIDVANAKADVDGASTLVHATGKLTWSGFPATFASGFMTAQSGGVQSEFVAVTLDPGGQSVTYDAIGSAGSPCTLQSLEIADHDPAITSNGVLAIAPPSTLDLSAVAGGTWLQSPAADLPAGYAFTTIQGQVVVKDTSGAALPITGGGVSVFVNGNNGDFYATDESLPAGGSFQGIVVGQAPSGYVSIQPNVVGCAIGASITVFPSLESNPVDLGTLSVTVDETPPGQVEITTGIPGWPVDASYLTVGAFAGDQTVQYCAPATQYFAPTVIGPQTFTFDNPSFGGTNVRPGPFEIEYMSTYVNFDYSLYRDFISLGLSEPSVRSGKTLSLETAENVVRLHASVDTSSWQLGPQDSVDVSAGFDVLPSGPFPGPLSGPSHTEMHHIGNGPQSQPVAIDLAFDTTVPWTLGWENVSAEFLDGGFVHTSNWFAAVNTVTLPAGTLRDGGNLPHADLLQLGGAATWTVVGVPEPPDTMGAVSQLILQGGDDRYGYNHNVSSYGFGTTISGKLPAGTYFPNGPPGDGGVGWFYYTATTSSVGFTALQGEIGAGDELTETINAVTQNLDSPILLHRTPAPGTLCAKPGESDGVNDDGLGGTVILVKCQVVSDLTQLQGLTINGQPAAADAGGNVSAPVLLKLGTNPVTILATATSGDATRWDRFYTVPVEMRSDGVLGPLVPAGTAPIPVPAAGVKFGKTLTLLLDVTSCGRPAGNLAAYPSAPALVDVQRANVDLALATIDPGAVDADGDVDFRHLGAGVWQLKLNTALFGGTGTFVLTFEDPAGNLYQGIAVVNP
jgi:hypothetical protein